jgi:hypothetical protein
MVLCIFGLRPRQRDFLGPQRDRRSRQAEAMLGVVLAVPAAHDRRNYVRTALVNVSAAHWLMLLPLTSAAAATAAWTSGGTRSMSLPE